MNKIHENIIFTTLFIFLIYFCEFLTSLFISNYSSLDILWNFKNLSILFVIGLSVSFLTSFVQIFIFIFISIFIFIQILYFNSFGVYIDGIDFYNFFLHFNNVYVSFLSEWKVILYPLLISVILVCGLLILVKYMNTKVYRKNYVLILIICSLYTDFSYKHINMNRDFLKSQMPHSLALKLMPASDSLALSNFYGAFQYLTLKILPRKIAGYNVGFTDEVLPSPILVGSKEANIVLVIGESLGAHRMSMFGYCLDTSPLLSKQTELHSSIIYSSGTFTKTSVSGIINRLKYPGQIKQIKEQNNCLFKLAKKNNFETYFISGHHIKDLSIINNLICNQYIDVSLSKLDFEKPFYDIKLVEYVKNINFDKNNFILLQLSGSHHPFGNKFPSKFKVFPSDYDNSVLYTDYVINTLIEVLQQKSNKPTYMIFTSDHGELLGEYGMHGHGRFKPEVYRVPFVVYSRDSDTLDMSLELIKSHFDMSSFIAKLLGYEIIDPKDSDIYINGTDTSGLSGYIRIRDNNITMLR